MRAIILFSHGSVLCGAGEALFDLARRMEARGDAPIVEAGFLNYSEPPFEAAFERCVERGATHIVIAPYFLVAGYFVKVSLPPKIEAMRARFPHVEVQVAEAMKRHELLAQAILNCAERAQEPSKWRDLLEDAPRFCRDNPQCPLHGTPKCPATAQTSPAAEGEFAMGKMTPGEQA
jgi:sirohydrochlorin ferrochelatase